MNKFLILILFSAVAIFTCGSASPGKFVIKGTVDSSMDASGVAIYIADKADNIIPEEPIARVKTKEGKFFYETELNDIKPGQIRVVLASGELDKSSINLDFVPDFTLYLNIHNGYYRIPNANEYFEKIEEHCLKNHVDPDTGKPYEPIVIKNGKLVDEQVNLLSKSKAGSLVQEKNGMSEILDSDITSDVKERYVRAELQKDALKTKLESYKQMLKYVENRILRSNNVREKESLFIQQNTILEKMQQAIDEYSKKVE